MKQPHRVANEILEEIEYVDSFDADDEVRNADGKVERITRRHAIQRCPDCGRGIFGLQVGGLAVVACTNLESERSTEKTLLAFERAAAALELTENDLIACGERPGT